MDIKEQSLERGTVETGFQKLSPISTPASGRRSMLFFLYAASELFEIASSAVFALSIVLFGTEWQAWSLGALLFVLGVASQLAAERVGSSPSSAHETRELPIAA